VKSGLPLRLFSASQQQVRLGIFSVGGACVFSGDVNTNDNIALPTLAPGIYLCDMQVAGQPQRTMLVVN
jgi:hypothetical protein